MTSCYTCICVWVFSNKSWNLESNLKSELKKQYEEFWKINIKRSSKLDTYSSFKSSFCAESYLSTIKNENKRKSLTRLKISAHTLEIERGRYKKLKRRTAMQNLP